MKFSTNKPRIDKRLKEFIEQNISLIEAKEFDELYRRAYQDPSNFEVGLLTHLLYSIDIDPLENQDYIPPDFCEGCDALIEVEIPNHIKYIHESGFYSCNNIAGIVIPKNVIELDSWSIAGCDHLKKIVILGDLQKLDRYTFGQNPELQIIYCTQKTADLINNTPEWAEANRMKNIKIEVIR